MSTSTRKTSRSSAITNSTKSTGTSRSINDVQKHKSRNLAVDGESKLVSVGTYLTPFVERPSPTTSKKNSISENGSVLLHHHVIPEDHSECKLTIQKLEEQVTTLLQEKKELKIDVKVLSAELSLEKEEKEKINNEKNILQAKNDDLTDANDILRRENETITQEMTTKKLKWQNEKDILEKALREIRKELEDKIIEIRAKHKDEVLSLEEKVRILKVRLSDTLKVNSWERQQEIDRIANDLDKSMASEENLKLQLKRLLPLISNEQLFCQQCHAEITIAGTSEQRTLVREAQFAAQKSSPTDLKRNNKEKIRYRKSADGHH